SVLRNCTGEVPSTRERIPLPSSRCTVLSTVVRATACCCATHSQMRRSVQGSSSHTARNTRVSNSPNGGTDCPNGSLLTTTVVRHKLTASAVRCQHLLQAISQRLTFRGIFPPPSRLVSHPHDGLQK